MRTLSISFKNSETFNKYYSLRTKDDKPIEKSQADKIVKRNMGLFSIVAIPAFMLGITSLIFRGKDNFSRNLIGTGVFAAISAMVFPSDYKRAFNNKDYAPERFYKWGNFKVINNA